MLNKDEMLARTSNGIACASLSYPLAVDTALFNRLAKSACVQPRLSLSFLTFLLNHAPFPYTPILYKVYYLKFQHNRTILHIMFDYVEI